MSDALKPGDIVILKSGSAPMTMSWLNREDCGVIWEDKDGVHHTATYQVAALRKA